MSDAVAAMRAQGAIVIDPADIPSIVTTDPARSLLKWGVCSGPEDAKGRDDDCSVVFKYGMKRDFNAWLASLGDRAPVKSLTALREWNRAHQSAGTLKYGQRNWTTRTKWISPPTGRGTRPTEPRTSPSLAPRASTR
jgi:amidase